MPLAIGVLCFAVAVEATQALGLIRLLGWSDNTLAMVVLGNTFQWGGRVGNRGYLGSSIGEYQ